MDIEQAENSINKLMPLIKPDGVIIKGAVIPFSTISL